MNLVSFTRIWQAIALSVFVGLTGVVLANDPPCGNPPKEGEPCDCPKDRAPPPDSSGEGSGGGDSCPYRNEPNQESGGGSSSSSGHTSSSCSTCSGSSGAENPIEPYSGNVHRQLLDLELFHTVGEHNIALKRRYSSRWDRNPSVAGVENPYGEGGSWRHSYQWNILDNGSNSYGPSLQIVYPGGGYGNFAFDSGSANYMTYLASTHERVEQDGTNFYLMFLNGNKYHITRYDVAGDTQLYRMEGFFDAYSNWYDFSYADDLLFQVTGPNTNQYLSFTYQTKTNSMQPGDIEFSLTDGIATQVLLAGSFNGWSGEEMAQSGSSWTYTQNLSEGFHEYKFLVRHPGQEDEWISDPDNENYVHPNGDSVLNLSTTPVTRTLLESVATHDGRSISYYYDGLWNPTGSWVYAPCLTNVVYGDGSEARYTYYDPADDNDRVPLLKTAQDPRYAGPAREILYLYQSNNLYSGQIYEERSLIDSQLFARLEISGDNPTWRRMTSAGGEIRDYFFSTNTGQMASFTNEVGYTTESEFYAGGDGFLHRSTDTKGRITSYSRTMEFGAVTIVSNSALGDTYTYYSSDQNPFYVTQRVDYAGRTNIYARDANRRVVKRVYPDGTYETNLYNSYAQLLTLRKQDGSEWTYAYDEKGRKSSETDPLGSSTWFGYDEQDQLSTVSNALGYVTSYSYNWRGQLTNVVYPDSSEAVFRFNDYGQETQSISRAGVTNHTSYDVYGHVSSKSDGTATSKMLYNLDGHLVSMTTPLGLTVSNLYDGLGRKVQALYSSDDTSHYWKYGPDGVVTQINRLNWTNVITYSVEGWVSSAKDELERVTSYGYNSAGFRTHVTNAMGHEVVKTYDVLGRLLRTEDCSGAVSSNTYDGLGRLLSTTDPNGNSTHYTYDANGRRVTVFREGYLLQSNAYNQVNWLVMNEDASGLVTTNLHDEMGRVIATYMPDGSALSNVYENTWLKKSYDRGGRMTTFDRDSLGRVVVQTDNNTNSITYMYDAAGNMTNLTDQAGNQTGFFYDEEGRQTAKAFEGGTQNLYAYDAGGQLTVRVMAGLTNFYRYDAVGNLTNIDYETDTDIYFTYDNLNRQTSMEDASGTTSNTYSGSCTKVDEVDGPYSGDTVRFEYDAGKRLISVTSGATFVEYEYDVLDRISAAKANGQTNGFAWLGGGRLLDQALRGNGAVVDYAYDTLNRLTSVVNRTSEEDVFASYSYALDASDQRTSVALDENRAIDYTYDPIGQILKADGDFEGHDFVFLYDKVGNPTHQERNGYILTNTFNGLNQNVTSEWSGSLAVMGSVNMTDGVMTVEGNPPSQRTAWSGADYAIFTATGLIASEGENFYSAVLTDPFERAETNIVSVVARGKGYQYDMRGNLTNDSEFAYGFNDENRLVSVARLSDTTLVMTCVYDATGRRREKVTYLDGGITNRYAYGASGLEWAVLAISDGADGLLEEYVHGPDLSGGFAGAGGIGGILSFRTWGGASVEEVGFLHYDGNGNMVSVSDDDESLLAKYEYSPFGMVLNHAGSFDSRYQFSSKEFDENVRMNYYGYRSYLSSAARWLNRDPLLEGGGVNLYRFNMGNPITRLDYLGLESCDPFTAEPRTWIDEDSCKISGGIFTGESSVETIGSPPRKAICKCEKIGAEKHCDQVTEDCMCVGTEYEGNTVIGIFEWIETERNQILLQEGLKAWVELLRIELSPSMHYWKFEALCKQACGNLKGQ